MRMMVKFELGLAATNAAIRNGTMAEINEQLAASTKPEAAYFGTENGRRTGYLVFDMDDPARIPVIAEPLFQRVGGDRRVHPGDEHRGPAARPRRGGRELMAVACGAARGWCGSCRRSASRRGACTSSPSSGSPIMSPDGGGPGHDALAAACDADADALDRVLRLVAAHGVFERRHGRATGTRHRRDCSARTTRGRCARSPG